MQRPSGDAFPPSLVLSGGSCTNHTLPRALPMQALSYHARNNLSSSQAAIFQLLRTAVADKASHPPPHPQMLGATIAALAREPTPASLQSHGKQTMLLKPQASDSSSLINSLKSSQPFKTINPRTTYLKAPKPQATSSTRTCGTKSAPRTGLQQSLLIGSQTVKSIGSMKRKASLPNRTMRKDSLGVATKRSKKGTDLQSTSIQQYFEHRERATGCTESQQGITVSAVSTADSVMRYTEAEEECAIVQMTAQREEDQVVPSSVSGKEIDHIICMFAVIGYGPYTYTGDLINVLEDDAKSGLDEIEGLLAVMEPDFNHTQWCSVGQTTDTIEASLKRYLQAGNDIVHNNCILTIIILYYVWLDLQITGGPVSVY